MDTDATDPNSATLYFDGCCKGNPGPGGCGAIIKCNQTYSYSEYIGITTNNVAEYRGLILGLTHFKNEIKGVKYLIIKGDSMLVINQMTGKYKVKSPHLLELYNQAIKIIGELCDVTVLFIHIPRNENKESDHLANFTLQTLCIDRLLKQPLVSNEFLHHHS